MTSFFTRAANPLLAKVDIVFDNDGVVDLLGGPNTGYSLAGHVVLAVPALPACFEGRPREIRELSVTMEGKSEYADVEGRYTPLRLHRSTITLATPSAPLLIPACNPAASSARVQMVVAFDLRVPGWLPATHQTAVTNTVYGAVANATIGWVNSETASIRSATSVSSAGSSSTFGAALRPRTRGTTSIEAMLHNASPSTAVSRFREFIVRRHRMPTALQPDAAIRERAYALQPNVGPASPLECLVAVPEWVDTHGAVKSLRVSLRVRARPAAETKPSRSLSASPHRHIDQEDEDMMGLPESDEEDDEQDGTDTRSPPSASEMLRLVELGMEVEETERFGSTVAGNFAAAFPLPAEQPSAQSNEHALLDPRPHDPMGRLHANQRAIRGTRTRTCLLADDGTQRNFFFAEEGLEIRDRWRRINVVLPLPSPAPGSLSVRPQAETDSPFLRIRHTLRTRIVCALADGPPMTVILSTPIRFGTTPATAPAPAPLACSAISADLPVRISTTHTLPAYVQLFHENGELRECDPLPLYSRADPDVAAAAAEPRTPCPGYVDAAWPSVEPASPGPSLSSSPAPALASSLSPSLASIASMTAPELAASLARASASPSPEPEPMAVDARAQADKEADGASDGEGAARKVARTSRAAQRRSAHAA